MKLSLKDSMQTGAGSAGVPRTGWSQAGLPRTGWSRTGWSYDCAVIHKAKELFQALYAQEDLDKAIGNLSFQDCLDLCKQMSRRRARKPRSTSHEKEA